MTESWEVVDEVNVVWRDFGEKREVDAKAAKTGLCDKKRMMGGQVK